MDTYFKKPSLAEAALFTAILAVIGLMAIYIPLLSFAMILVMPAPLAILVCRQNIKQGFLSFIVAAIVLFILCGNPLAIMILLIQAGPLGLLLGLLFKNNVTSGKGIAATSVVAVLTTVLTLLLGFWFTGINPFVMSNEMMDSMEQAIKWYTDMGMFSENEMGQAKESLEQMMTLFALLFPGNMVIWSIISAYLTYVLTRLCLVKLNLQVLPLPPFSRWFMPWYGIWGAILGLGSVLLASEFDSSILDAIGKNLLYVMGFLYCILGIAVVAFYFKKWKTFIGLKIIIVVLIVFYGPFILILLGVLDPIFDLRRLARKKDTKGD